MMKDESKVIDVTEKNGVPFRQLGMLAACMAFLPLSTATAAEEEYDYPDWTVSVGAGALLPDDERDLDDAVAAVFGLEYRFVPRLGLELRFATGETEPSALPDENVDVVLESLDLLYHFEGGDGYKGFEPYAALGVGNTRFDSRLAKERETHVNAGGGVHYVFNERWSARGDVRYFDSYTSDGLLVSLGLSYSFGGQSEATAPVPARPARVEETTPVEPAPVVATDMDNDGVTDDKDQCPDSLRGLEVDEFGCEVRTAEPLQHELMIHFANNSAVVDEAHKPELKKLTDFLARHPDSQVVIEGHTDNIGDADYNRLLSLRRAEEIRDTLIEDFGLSDDRVEAVGYGETRPVGDNTTPEGRAHNRRVYAIITFFDHPED